MCDTGESSKLPLEVAPDTSAVTCDGDEIDLNIHGVPFLSTAVQACGALVSNRTYESPCATVFAFLWNAKTGRKDKVVRGPAMDCERGDRLGK